MNMNIDKDGNITFKCNYYDFLDSLPEEQQLELAESLSCSEFVIKNVVDQILDGYTEDNGCHGDMRYGTYPSTALELARERIANQGNRLLKDEVKRLRRVCERKEKALDNTWNEYHKLNNRLKGQYSF